MKLFPSLISSDLLSLGNTIKQLDAHCDGYHIDVMDFHFVPNLTWGPQFIAAFTKATKLPLQIHLMVDDPVSWCDNLTLRQQDSFLFHYEAMRGDLSRCAHLIDKIKKKGWQSGIVVNPETPIDAIFSLLDSVDHVLIMSVHPGFSGQQFIPDVLEKIKVLVETREQKNLSFQIGIDGGVNKDTVAMISSSGTDWAGIASAIFSQGDAVTALQELYEKSG